MDKMRWRYGDTNPVVAAVDAKTVIEIGDLVFQDVDDAKPASMRAGPCVEPTVALELFTRDFLGVAMQRSRRGDTDPIRVATTGVFDFDCPEDRFELGDLIGPLGEPGAGLKSQRVAAVNQAKHAIGRVAKRAAVEVTTVLVDVRSTVMTGGVNGSTAMRDD